MAKNSTSPAKPKKKHHRLKKLVKLAAVAGAVYGAKKLWDQQHKKKPVSGSR